MELENILKHELFAYDPGAHLWFAHAWEEAKPLLGGGRLDSPIQQLKAILLAVGLKRLYAEFYRQLEGGENEIGSLDVFDLMDQLEWSEEAVWFLAGVYSREDAEYEQLLAEGDIHEILDFMVLNTARWAARLLTESITAEVLFVRFYIAENMEADQEPGLEDPAAYRRYIEEHMAVLNEVDPGKEQAYAWLSDRMPL